MILRPPTGFWGHQGAHSLIPGTSLRRAMPKTLDVACLDPDCRLDMFTLHYPSFTPDDEFERTYRCPECGGDRLRELP